MSSGVAINDGPLTNDGVYTLSVTNDAGTPVTRDVTLEVDHLMYIAGTAGNIGGPGLISVYPSHLKDPGPALRRIYVQNCGWPTGLAHEPAVGPGPAFLWVVCRPRGTFTTPLVARIQSPQTVNSTAAVPTSSALTPISGSNTLLTQPQSMVIASGQLVVVNQATLTTRASINVFSMSAGGNVAPVRSIIPPTSGDLTQLGQTSQIFAYQNELYVTSNAFNGFGTEGVLVYPLNWTGTNIAPTRTLTSPVLAGIRAVYVDSTGIVAGGTMGSAKWALGSTGTAAPLVTSGAGASAQYARFDSTLYSGARFGVVRQPVSLIGPTVVIGNTLMDFDTPAATVIDPAF